MIDICDTDNRHHWMLQILLHGILQFVILAVLFICPVDAYSQGMAVEKFEAALNDLTANKQGTMVLDQNGDV